ncbi:endo-1,4-beta-xylanase [Pararcticibacter amylolyticus]|uniref:Beta-xylanase n=1 Tax=Pararcticibacter amylolyticus TaxID=2173175 RepID=A0A2U2PLD8_9SPHI|nr:endo-1,4-beta-xylanase [Pararcticibacter amylolyticus]PWG82211.1 endo-1,4-beta-xylanase [Pararcticibacter amylolyticus]
MRRLRIILAVVTLLTGLNCSKSDEAKKAEPPVPDPPATEETSLRKALPFPFGAAVNINLLKTRVAYRDLVVREYNSLTPENAMKASVIHPQQNTYNWADADYLVDFAKQNNKRVHGHTLIWYKSLPSWITEFQGDAAAWDNLFKTHIQTIVTHFKGKVASWDVVNEAIADDGTLRPCIWLEKIGPDYIAKAFQYAHEADPDALLFYNDYGHEYGPTKRGAILDLINDLKNRHIPVHGIGLQMHTRYNMADNNLANAINTVAQTGLKIHIAELDIAINPDNLQALTFSPALAEQQSQKYKFIVKTYNALPANQKFGITTWNVGDADSWIPGTYNRPDWPLPFDGDYKKKPAYQGILDGVK